MEGRKNDSGKLRYELIPWHPLRELAHVYTLGATKYDPWNWKKGLAWGRVFGAMMRHAWDWVRGEKYDRECLNPECRTYLPTEASEDREMPCPQCGTGGKRQHHLSSVAWGAFTLMDYERLKVGEDDRNAD